MSDYTTLSALKSDLDVHDTDEDAALQRAITAASRAIDRWTGTTFYPVTETRVFATRDPYKVWVDQFTSATNLVVKTGTSGLYASTIADTDYVLWPYNAPKRLQSYRRIDSPGARFSVENRPTVEVTATWGWDFLPDDVERAARIKAAHLFRRKDTPDGVAGSSEYGVVRISKYEDPDVVLLLNPFSQSWLY